MYAVIESGGKQHRVEPGEVLRLEKVKAEAGETIDFDKVSNLQHLHWKENRRNGN